MVRLRNLQQCLDGIVGIVFARKIKHNNCREEPKITLFILGKETLKVQGYREDYLNAAQVTPTLKAKLRFRRVFNVETELSLH